jgi:hypothetical protein
VNQLQRACGTSLILLCIAFTVALWRIVLTCVMAGRCAATVCPTPLLLAAVVPAAVRGIHDCCGVGALIVHTGEGAMGGVLCSARIDSAMHCAAVRWDGTVGAEKFESR